MRKLYSFIVDNRIAVTILFAIIFTVCLFLRGYVSVNYDINDYLPPDAHSTVSLDVMTSEFTGGIPNARVMVENVTIPEALSYKARFEKVEGVLSVTWLDDAADIRLPLSAIDESVLETYYKDGAALFSMSIDEEYYIPATEEIRSIIGDDNAMSGSATSIAITMSNTVSEIAKIAAVAVLFVLIVLILTTDSWLEPLLVLGGLGVAIVINGGTNLIFGEISFVTNAAGSILQLGVSLDYSVFLIHRFEECRSRGLAPREAMIDALCLSTSSILSSGLTTVIGFLALVFMRFGIGPDLGLALAKGVAISLITVFFFMPALLLLTEKLSDKLRHRHILPNLGAFGKIVRRAAIPMVCVFAVVIIPAYLASNSNSYYYGSLHIFGDDTQFGRDSAAIDDRFGKSDTFVLLVPGSDTAKEAALSRDLHKLPNIKSMISYVDTVGAEIPPEYLDPETLAALRSENYSRMVITAAVPVESEETFELVQRVRDTAEKYYPGEYCLAGQAVSTYDMMDTVTSDMIKVNTVAIAAVFIVLILTLRSVVLPVILVLSIEAAIWINLAVPYFAGDSIFYIAYLIISSIQLGSTVDYAILMTDRYRENRASLPKKEAVVKTVSDVTVSIITSGSVLTVVGLLLGFISSNQLLAQLGIFIGRGAVLSLVIVLFVLPGLLYLFDSLTVKRKKNARENIVS